MLAASSQEDTFYHWHSLIDQRLRAVLPDIEAQPLRLHEAMHYAALSPGKRVRPLLCVLSCEALGGDPLPALDVGAALEMVHAASLILDDLPSMDDAALRRGQPTVHKIYGEDIAILAAVALLNQAFAVVHGIKGLEAATALKLVGLLAATIGSQGLIGGQVDDLHTDVDMADMGLVQSVHQRKTGILFETALATGALLAGASDKQHHSLRDCAHHLGLAFQIRDDVLDSSQAHLIGKDVGKDAGKPSFVTVMGLAAARQALGQHVAMARAALTRLDIDAAARAPFDILITRLFPDRAA
jgi:geranylgeranyl diphosphate synthase, type II